MRTLFAAILVMCVGVGCGLKPSKDDSIPDVGTVPSAETSRVVNPAMPTLEIPKPVERPTNTPLDYLSVASGYRNGAFSTGDKRYKGKLVYVNDRVWSIGEENGRPYVGVYGDDKISPLMYCFFENDADVDQFHIGKRTSLEGVVMGAVRDNVYRPKQSDNFHVVVDQCRIK